MIKLIATDIDETIVPESCTTPNPEYFEVIKKLQEKGIMFIAASGRHRDSVLKTFAPLGSFGVFGNNGTDIHCYGYVHAMELAQDQYLALIADLKELPEEYAVMACNADATYIAEKDYDFYRRMSDIYKFKCVLIPDLAEVNHICKISAFNKDGFAKDIAANLYDKWSGSLEANAVGKYFFDFMMKGSNKGKALSLVQEHFGISPEETAVFGDSANDYSMFEHAKYSYAVANADQILLDNAYEVIGPMAEDGVLKKLKEWL